MFLLETGLFAIGRVIRKVFLGSQRLRLFRFGRRSPRRPCLRLFPLLLLAPLARPLATALASTARTEQNSNQLVEDLDEANKCNLHRTSSD